jgi:hypothetical protein
MIPLTVGAEFDVMSEVSPNQCVWFLPTFRLAPSDGGFFL